MHAVPPPEPPSVFPGFLNFDAHLGEGWPRRIFRAPPLERFFRQFDPAEFAADLLSLGLQRSAIPAAKRHEE